MNLRSSRINPAAPLILLIGFLAMGLGVSIPAASAEDYPVLDGSGYEGNTSIVVDYSMLNGSGYERYAAVQPPDHKVLKTGSSFSVTSVLDGSGYELTELVFAPGPVTTSSIANDASANTGMFGAILSDSGYEVASTVAIASE